MTKIEIGILITAATDEANNFWAVTHSKNSDFINYALNSGASRDTLNYLKKKDLYFRREWKGLLNGRKVNFVTDYKKIYIVLSNDIES